MLLDKLESGIVALETENGHVYVQPSAWQRFYLVWTFRHFNSLPIQTLNSRQRKLIQRLPRCNSQGFLGQPDRTQLIGTVEGAALPSFTSASRTEIRANVEPASPVLEKIEAANRIPEIRSAPGFDFGIVRASLAVALITGFLYAMSAFAPWRRFRHVESAIADTAQSQVLTAETAIQNQATSGKIEPQVETPVPLSVEADFQPINHSAGIAHSPFAPVVAVSAEPTQPRAFINPPADSKIVAAAKISRMPIGADSNRGSTTAAGIREGTSQEGPVRIQFSGPPIRIIYPDYPETSTRGKVTLRALIGGDGKVHEVTTLSGNKLLSAAAARAIRQWRYTPVLKDGEPVEAETSISVLFVSADVISISFPKVAPLPE
ncbi:MAG: energy transducer TonB [Terriglobales bacterium]